MTKTITRFNQLNITLENSHYTGDKIKISRVLNREITVHAFKVTDSKHNTGKCLHMQIDINGTMHVVFTGSAALMEMIEKVPKQNFPFITTIIEENERYKFT